MLTDKNGKARLEISYSYIDIDVFHFDIEDTELEDCDSLYKYRLNDEDGDMIEEYFNITSLDIIKDQLPEEWKSENMNNYLI